MSIAHHHLQNVQQERDPHVVRTPLEDLGASDLAMGVKNEIHSSRRGEEGGDSHHCRELLRRVAMTPDGDAWVVLYAQFSPLVCSCLLKQARGREAVAIEGTADPLVAAVFEKLWLTLRTGTKRFLSVGAFLSYLKACAGSVLADWWRAYSLDTRTRATQMRGEAEPDFSGSVSLDKGPFVNNDPATEVIACISYQEIVQVIRDELRGEEEHSVGSLSLLSGLSPADILRERPDLFTSVKQVYRVKRNVIERLRRRLTRSLSTPVTRAEQPADRPSVPAPEDDEAKPSAARSAVLVVLEQRMHSLLEQTESFVSKGIRYYKHKAFCSKARCRKCREGIGHGPYWYSNTKNTQGRWVRTYLGRVLPSSHQSNSRRGKSGEAKKKTTKS